VWAYVATQQLDKAKAAMNALEKAGGVNVARIYVSLGRQLEDSYKRLRAEGDGQSGGKGCPRLRVLPHAAGRTPRRRVQLRHALLGRRNVHELGR